MKHLTTGLLILLLGIYAFIGVYIYRESIGYKTYNTIESKVISKDKSFNSRINNYDYYITCDVESDEVVLYCNQSTYINIEKGSYIKLKQIVYTNGNGKQEYSYMFME